MNLLIWITLDKKGFYIQSVGLDASGPLHHVMDRRIERMKIFLMTRKTSLEHEVLHDYSA